MEDWKFHQACLLFPPLSEAELKALAEDIRQRGLIHPIITHDGMILDGRNRLAGCEIAGVEPRFEEWTGTGSALEWAISTNLHRRHLTASQRAVLGLDMLPLLEEEAKERQRLSAGRGQKVAKSLATFSTKGKSSQFAAQLAGTNSAYIEQVKCIRRKAPALIEEVKLGNLTMTEASRLSKLDTFQREKYFSLKADQPDEKFSRLVRQVLMKTEQPEAASSEGSSINRIEVWCGDCLGLMRKNIPDATIDVICTSPPFNRGLNYGTYDDDRPPIEFDKWLDEVFSEFKRVLNPNGSVFLIVGHSPRHPWTAVDMAKIAAKHFTLQNQIVWVKSISIADQSHGHFTPIPGPRYLNRNWDFVFHFTKNGTSNLDRKAVGVPYADSNNAVRGGDGNSVRCTGDVWFIPFETVHDADERGNHPATFPPDVAERCLKLAGCTSDSKVLDPFCGVNGLIAASRLGLNAIGIDIYPHFCRNAASRANGRMKDVFPNGT